MVREYVISKKDKNSLGSIALSTNVFESIVLLAMEDNPDIRPCVSTRLYRPIVCKIQDGRIYLKCDVICKVGCNVPSLSDEVLKEMRYAIFQMTGYENLKIDLNIRGFYL